MESGWVHLGFNLEELRRLQEWRVVHIYRQVNEAAHLLASIGNSHTDSQEWVGTRVMNWVRELGSRFGR